LARVRPEKAEAVMDRRVQRTRETLHRALMELMVARRYEDITVQDILDRANVGRSTFYAHYRGKEELLKAGLRNLGKELLQVQRDALARPGRYPERALGFSRAFFEHADSHRAVYHAIVGKRSGTVVMNGLRGVFTELVRNELVEEELAPGIPRAAAVQFIVGTLMSVLTWWMEDRAGVAAADADALFRRLALRAVLAERNRAAML
jgi:AcrR family transcriptional regulator